MRFCRLGFGVLSLSALSWACGSSSTSSEATSGTAGALPSNGGGGGTQSSGGAPGMGGAGAGRPSQGGASNGGSAVAAGGSSGGTTGRGGAAASGGSAKGGAAPQGGSPPLTVTACPDAVKKVGVWENISPQAFVSPSNMETLAVVVNPLDQTVYAAAGNKTNGGNAGTGVLKSTDCGATWQLVSTAGDSASLLTGDPWAMMIDPQHPNTMYVNNGYGDNPTLYKSTDGGKTFSALAPHPKWGKSSFVQAIAMEPGNPQHIAVTFHSNCESPSTPACLGTSDDAGAKWNLIDGPKELGGWQEAATLSVLGPTSYLLGADGGWFTENDGKTWTKVIEESFLASYAGSTDLAPNGTLFLTGVGSVYQSKSTPLGKSWSPVGNSGRWSSIINDGESLIASWAWETGGKPFHTAKLSDPTSWTQMDSPNIGRGSNQFAHDPVHHIVYSANWGAGLWRIVTR